MNGHEAMHTIVYFPDCKHVAHALCVGFQMCGSKDTGGSGKRHPHHQQGELSSQGLTCRCLDSQKDARSRNGSTRSPITSGGLLSAASGMLLGAARGVTAQTWGLLRRGAEHLVGNGSGRHGNGRNHEVDGDGQRGEARQAAAQSEEDEALDIREMLIAEGIFLGSRQQRRRSTTPVTPEGEDHGDGLGQFIPPVPQFLRGEDEAGISPSGLLRARRNRYGGRPLPPQGEGEVSPATASPAGNFLRPRNYNYGSATTQATSEELSDAPPIVQERMHAAARRDEHGAPRSYGEVQDLHFIYEGSTRSPTPEEHQDLHFIYENTVTDAQNNSYFPSRCDCIGRAVVTCCCLCAVAHGSGFLIENAHEVFQELEDNRYLWSRSTSDCGPLWDACPLLGGGFLCYQWLQGS
ncbi:unnamed protein product [Amoebophrya sp. A25]|nr:unnamed protein product [Amoebophrya sp. A25]|eukprot:GSA25T00010658001.1